MKFVELHVSPCGGKVKALLNRELDAMLVLTTMLSGPWRNRSFSTGEFAMSRPSNSLIRERTASLLYWILAVGHRTVKQIGEVYSSETNEMLEKYRNALINRLGRVSDDKSRGLGARISACSPGLPCCSAACPGCGGQLQRFLVTQLLKKMQPSSDYMEVKILLSNSFIESGKLSSERIRAVHSTVNSAFQKAKLTQAFCWIDVSVSSAGTQVTSETYCIMGRALIHNNEVAKLEEAVGPDILPVLKDCNLTLVGGPWDGSVRWLVATTNPIPKHHFSVPVQAKEGRGRDMDVRFRALSASQSVKLAMALDGAGLEHRFVLCGLALGSSRADGSAELGLVTSSSVILIEPPPEGSKTIH